jgi:hypothetical protein
MPLIVPCTWVAPASTATSVLATAQPESSWVWMPSASCGSRDDLRDGAREAPAVGVAQDHALRTGIGGGAQAVERVGGVKRVAVEEVLGVEQYALAVRDEERDGLLDHREVLIARDAQHALDVRDRALADERADRREGLGENPQSLVGFGTPAAAARHPERDDLGVLERLVLEQVEELLLLGVR